MNHFCMRCFVFGAYCELCFQEKMTKEIKLEETDDKNKLYKEM